MREPRLEPIDFASYPEKERSSAMPDPGMMPPLTCRSCMQTRSDSIRTKHGFSKALEIPPDLRKADLKA